MTVQALPGANGPLPDGPLVPSESRGRGGHTAFVRGGRALLTEILLPQIARLASNCSTGNCLSNYKFNKRISSKSSNSQNVAR